MRAHEKTEQRKWVYDFDEGSREMRTLLGGKGAGIAEMTRMLGADRVPGGFTITTERLCGVHAPRPELPHGLDAQVDEALARLERRAGKRLGDPADPLLVSVRSGARESMPGMLDTVLNLGLSDDVRRGPGRANRERALRLGLLPAPRADVRQRRARRPRRALRGGDRRAQARARRHARHRARRRRPARADDALRAFYDFPSAPREQLSRRSAPCSTPGWASAPCRTAGSTASPTSGEPRSTCSRWSTGTSARAPARAWPSAATSSRARPSLPGLPPRRAGRGRRLRRAHTARPQRAEATGCRRRPTS